VIAAQVASVLAEIGMLSELNDPKPFRARAYMAAARAIEIGSHDLVSLAAENRLTEIPGIGAGIADTIRELVETGRSVVHEELRAATPAGLHDLLRIPGLGPRRIRTVHAELGVDSLDELERAVLDGRLASLPGFGPKTAEKVIAGIAFVREGAGRLRFPDAWQIAERLLAEIRAAGPVVRAEAAGAIRRLLEVVDEVELVVGVDGDPGEALRDVPFFRTLTGEARATGLTLSGSLVDGSRARIHVVPVVDFTRVWHWETGSAAHLEALDARARGKGVPFGRDEGLAGDEEAALYRALDLPWIAPELREGLGEIEDAERDGAADLIRMEDLRGTFHCHTTYSDGKATLEEMAEGAAVRGWRYLGIADHSQSAAYAGGLSPREVHEQHDAIDRANAGSSAVHLFKGIESDILGDGRLDYPDELLASFDYVVGSVHFGFRNSESEMTERIVRAVRNPYLTMLGHPTGRRLLTRGGYPLDVRAVIDAAADEGVIVEINANPHRLDLDWRHLRYAVERGVKLAINPDAHSLKGLDDVVYGINMARKGAVAPHHVVNTWSLEEVKEYLAGRKARVAQGA
jgi:DNA polymerase (family X)